MQKEKGISTLVGIIIIVVVALILFGGIFAWQYYFVKTNNQSFVASAPQDLRTTGWKTYTNTEYGFQMKYPEDLKIEEIPAGMYPSTLLRFYNETYIVGNPFAMTNNFTIDSVENTSNLTAQQIIEASGEVNLAGGNTLKTLSDITVSGVKGKKVSYENDSRATFIAYVIRSNMVYNFGCDHQKTSALKYDCSTFDQMLSTFKFTK